MQIALLAAVFISLERINTEKSPQEEEDVTIELHPHETDYFIVIELGAACRHPLLMTPLFVHVL